MANLKKTLLYLILAVVVGVILMVAPLITIAQFKPEDHFMSAYDLPKQMRNLERSTVYDSAMSEDPSKDLEVLSISFVVAVGVYVLVRRKRPRQGYRTMGQYPYQF